MLEIFNHPHHYRHHHRAHTQYEKLRYRMRQFIRWILKNDLQIFKTKNNFEPNPLF